MRKQMIMIFVCVGAFMLSGSVFAGSMTHGAGHGSGHGDHASGKKIHQSHVDGYMFEYRLIDMKEKMKGMKNMPEMKETHHLMLHVKDKNGKMVDKAKVGYLIEGPEKSVEKKMAMAMNKGFGADVTFQHGKHYKVKAKVVAGETKLMDTFDFMLGH